MFKKLRREPLAAIVIGLMLAFALIAAKPYGMTHLTSLWIGDRTDTADVTPGDNDAFISGTLEVDGAARLDGALAVAGTFTNSNTQGIHIDLLSAWLEAVGMLGNDGTTAPGVSVNATDGVPAVVWASSAEAASIGYVLQLPPDYSTGLEFRVLWSSSANTTSAFAMAWELWVNKAAIDFDAAAFAQTDVTIPSGTLTPSASNVLLTFTADATALAGMVAGDFVTLIMGGGDLRAETVTSEIKAIGARYTATR